MPNTRPYGYVLYYFKLLTFRGIFNPLTGYISLQMYKLLFNFQTFSTIILKKHKGIEFKALKNRTDASVCTDQY